MKREDRKFEKFAFAFCFETKKKPAAFAKGFNSNPPPIKNRIFKKSPTYKKSKKRMISECLARYPRIFFV